MVEGAAVNPNWQIKTSGDFNECQLLLKKTFEQAFQETHSFNSEKNSMEQNFESLVIPEKRPNCAGFEFDLIKDDIYSFPKKLVKFWVLLKIGLFLCKLLTLLHSVLILRLVVLCNLEYFETPIKAKMSVRNCQICRYFLATFSPLLGQLLVVLIEVQTKCNRKVLQVKFCIKTFFNQTRKVVVILSCSLRLKPRLPERSFL